MILEMIMNVVYSIFNLLTSPIDVPPMPSNVSSFLEQAFDYIEIGVGFLANYTDLVYLLVLFGIIVVIDLAISIYHLVMWILKKIPFASVS